MSTITNRTLASAVLAQLKDGESYAAIVRGLSGYLVAQRRSKDIDPIMRIVEQELVKRNGHVEIRTTTARELSNEMKHTISSLIAPKAKKTVVHEIIDPAVIGGVLVETSGKRLDLTVRRRLQRLKNQSA